MNTTRDAIRYKGLHSDNHPSMQPDGTYRYVLNGMALPSGLIASEHATIPSGVLPDNKICIGVQPTDTEDTILFCVDTNYGDTYIYLHNTNGEVKELLQSSEIGLKASHPVDSVFRIRNGCERNVYFTSGITPPMVINIDDLDSYLKDDYQSYPPNQIYDVDKMKLILPTPDEPKISLSVLEGGELEPGAYSIGVIYLNDEHDQTPVSAITGHVNIFHSNISVDPNNVWGSHSTIEDIYNTTKTGKRIEVNISNPDKRYKYAKIVVFAYTSGDGTLTNTFASTEIPISDNIKYSIPSTKTLEKIDDAKIAFDSVHIHSAEHIEQIDNTLVLANTKEAADEIYSFQRYASRIKTSYVVKSIPAFEVRNGHNKHPLTPVEDMSFQSGEVYAFGIVYILEDGYHTPVFHIPGIAPDSYAEQVINYNDDISAFYSQAEYDALPPEKKFRRFQLYDTSHNNEVLYWKGAMSTHRSLNSKYPNIETNDGLDYWGRDYLGNDLTGTYIRHHKFPDRSRIDIVTRTDSDISTSSYNLYVIVKLKPDNYTDPNGNTSTEFPFSQTPGDTPSITLTVNHGPDTTDVEITSNDIGDNVYVSAVDSTYDPNTTTYTWSLFPQGADPNTFIESVTFVKIKTDSFSKKNGTIQKLGVKFENIQYPPGVVGHYIVCGVRDEANRTIIDSFVAGHTVSNDKFIASARFNNMPDHGYPNVDYQRDVVWVMSPKSRMLKKTFSGGYLDVVASYELKPYGNGIQEKYGDSGVEQNVVDGTSDKGFFGIKFDKDGWSWALTYRAVDYRVKSTPIYPKGIYRIDRSATLAPTQRITGFKDSKTLYNASFDDRQVIALINRDMPLRNAESGPDKIFELAYGYIRTYQEVYPDLRSIRYRKISSEQNSTQTTSFAGDVYIGDVSLMRTQFFETKSKRRWLSTILRVVAIIALTIAAIATAGALAPEVAGIISMMAIATAAVGVTAEMLTLFYKDIENGLKDVIADPLIVQHQVKDKKDDTIIYYGEVIESLFFESEVPVGLSSNNAKDCNAHIYDVSDDAMKGYLFGKYLYPDKDRGGAFTLKPVPCPEMLLVNEDYTIINKEKLYSSFPYDMVSKSNCIECFPTRVRISIEGFENTSYDGYRVFRPNDYIDIDSSTGKITDLWTYGGNLMIHTDDALYKLPRYHQERATDELVTYIGTASRLAIPPIKVIDDDGNSVGTNMKWATAKTPAGVIFISERLGSVWKYTGRLSRISDIGMSRFFKDNAFISVNAHHLEETGIDIYGYGNPYAIMGLGYMAGYDPIHTRYMLSKRDTYIPDYHINLSSDLLILYNNELVRINNYKQVIQNKENNGWKYVGISDGKLRFIGKTDITQVHYDTTLNGNTYTRIVHYEDRIYSHVSGTPLNSAENPIENYNDRFTISFDIQKNKWISFHSYSGVYWNTDTSFVILDTNKIARWKRDHSRYLNVLDHPKDFIVEYVSKAGAGREYIWEHIDVGMEARVGRDRSNEKHFDIFFDKLIAYNSHQSTGEATIQIYGVEEDMSQIVDDSYFSHANYRDGIYRISGIRNRLKQGDHEKFLYDPKSTGYLDKVIDQNSYEDMGMMHDAPMKDDHLVIRLIMTNHDQYPDHMIILKTETEAINKIYRR